MNVRIYVCAFASTLLFFSHSLFGVKPNLIIVLVVDQLSYQTVANIKPYCTGGLRQLLDKGIVYTNAQWPHAMPGTGPGHTSLSTGALPSMHGIIDNMWIDSAGNRVHCDDDTNPASAVFSPTGELYSFGKSAHNIMVDTLSDQCMFQSTPVHTNKSVSLSLKSRSGIAMAGHCGTAFWLDDDSCFFTSSKAYLAALPSWIKNFNTTFNTAATYTWQLTYAPNHPAYQWADTDIYRSTKSPSAIGRSVQCNHPDNIVFTPYAHTLLFDCARECLRTQLPTTTGTFILWLGLSSTDKIGHLYGTNSLEYLDMLYKLDRDVATFIQTVYTLNRAEKTLFVLTADHGSMPIPERIAQKGFTQAQRLSTPALRDAMNSAVEEQFGIENFVHYIDTPDIYFNRAAYAKMPMQQRKKIIKFLQEFVQHRPGIRAVWTPQQLMMSSFAKDDIRWLFQNQLYPERSGDLIFQVLPYVYPDKFTTGTGHRTPYNYDRHVPLIMYQPGTLRSAVRNELVYGQQVAPTLAYMTNIPQPSACSFVQLPGIDYTLYNNNNNNGTNSLTVHPFMTQPKNSTQKLP